MLHLSHWPLLAPVSSYLLCLTSPHVGTAVVAKTKKASEQLVSQRHNAKSVCGRDSAFKETFCMSHHRGFLILCYAHFCHSFIHHCLFVIDILYDLYNSDRSF